MMNTTDEQPLATMTPSALRPELAARFLAAMQHAAADDGVEELEARLRRLSPAPLGQEHSRNWLAAMQAAPVVHHGSAWYRFSRWSAAAALFFLCSVAGLLMVNSRASATVPTSLAYRSVLDSHAAEAVQWHEGQTPLRSCEVLYEDSFVLDGEEGSTITVRVPVRTQVMIEEEVI